MRKDPFGLTELLEPSITAMGYTLWGIEFHANSVNALLRIFIDKESGVSVDDCAEVSHQVEGLLDVNDPISTAYTLEVSSPGLDRSFFSIEQMMQYVSSEMDVQLISVVNNRRRFKAVLSKIEGESLTFFIPKMTGKKGKAARQVESAEGEELVVDYSMLDKVNLSPTFPKK
ncbi:MAG: ribosome maturation factor RimP [Wohlfahrtiimonas sp.]